MQLFKKLEDAISKHPDNTAFCIDNQSFTYRELGEKIISIRHQIAKVRKTSTNIGLVANDDLETYAAIIAIWFEGSAYVPVNPQIPVDRNAEILQLAGIETIIDSSATPLFPGYDSINSRELPTSMSASPLVAVTGDDLAYIVFTSGSTGVPKGVPISVDNLSNFVEAFYMLGLDLDSKDRWLQMFDLTFDLSVMSYLMPLLTGGCVYTIPKQQIKYNYIFRLMDEQHLTVALMIPSILYYLRPYFDEIDCPKMKYNLFCGEALPLDVTTGWSNCIVNAKILNVYGPSEATIFCTHYLFDTRSNNKSQNGILSIGKAMNGTGTIILDETGNLVQPGETGELCLSGKQLTPGYLNDPAKNKSSFFTVEQNNITERFYRTGDLCTMDDSGDIMYLGRIDSQVKIQGYRVELSEIEFHAKSLLTQINVLALAFINESGGREIGLLIESDPFETTALVTFLKNKIPFYMVPTRIRFEKEFQLNSNGKTDRKRLLKRLEE